MSGGNIGTVFVELDLDPSRYTKGQQKLYKDATRTTLNIEENFRKLGIKSSAEMDLLRAKTINAFNMIAHSSKATANDIMRAEMAKNATLKQLAEQQYGHQKSLLDRLKAYYTGTLSHATRSFTGTFSRATRSIINTERSIMNLKNAIVLLAGSAGIGLTAKAFIHAADSAERYRIRLRFLLRSQEEGNKVFQAMNEYASKVPHQFENILEAAARLGGAVQGSSEEIIKWMPMIGDLAAVTGTNIQTTISQFIRMYSAGAQAADMFREHGYLAMMGFKTGVHYTAEETRKILWESWTKADSQFKDATKELEKTWTGLMGHMSDRWYRFRIKVMDKGIFDMLKSGVDDLIDKIDDLERRGQLDVWAKTMASRVIRSVEIVTYAFESWLMVIHEIKAAYSFIKAEALDVMIPGLEKEREKLIKAAGPDKGLLSSALGLVLPSEAETEMFLAQVKRIQVIDDLILKYKEYRAESRLSVAEHLAAMEKINKRFEEARQWLEDLRTGWIKIRQDLEKHKMEYLKSMGVGYIFPMPKSQELIEEWTEGWKDFSKDAADILTNALVDGSKDFLEQFRRLMASTFAEQFIKPMIAKVMGSLFTPKTGLLMGKAFGIEGVGSYANILGAGAMGYGLGGVGSGLGAAGGFMAGSSLLTEGIFAKGGALAGLGGPIGMLTGGLLGGAIGDLFGGEKEDPYKLLKEMKAQYFNEMKSTFASAISEGFKAGTESEGYKSFIDSMKSSMAEIVKNMFMETFVAQTIKPLMGLFEPVFTQVNALMYSTTADFEEKVNKLVGQLKFMDIYKQIGLKENEIRAYAIEQLKGKYGIPSGIGEIAGAFPERGEIEFFFQQYQPYFEEVSNAMESVTSALGLNTDAIDENTAAILGPVDQYLSTLASMDTGPTSIAAITGRQSELWTKAFASPESFSAYSQFMTGGALDMFSKLSPGYIQGEIQRVQNIGWYQQAKYPAPEYMERAPGPGGSGIRYSPSTQENVAAIKQALGPMFLDLKESQSMPTKITVVFGNKEFDAVLVDSLHNTDVAEEVRYVVSG